MDFSASNAQLWTFLLQFGGLSGILLFANMLRRKLPFIKKTLMPTSVIAGFILLLIRSLGFDLVKTQTLETVTYHAIALGFIALALRTPDAEEKGDPLVSPKSGALIVSCYTIQGIIGLVIAFVLFYTIKPDLFVASGLLLPMGYGQGPGQANNIGTTYENLGFAGGRSFGLSLAAAGYLVACLVGVTYLNVLYKKGKFSRGKVDEDSYFATIRDFQDHDEIAISESIDRFSIQMAMVLGVYLLTYYVILGITSLTGGIGEGLSNTINTLLWGFNFMIGMMIAMFIRMILGLMKKQKWMTHQYQNNYLLTRVSGFAFDLMVIGGIALIDIGDIKGLWLPFILMAAAGAAITLFYLQWICKKIYPEYYYEGLLSMYGMMTGTISSGVLLLREIDPMFKTKAANNLVTGSAMAVVFGAPMLALIGIAPNSVQASLMVLGLLVIYTALLVLFMVKVNKKAKK